MGARSGSQAGEGASGSETDFGVAPSSDDRETPGGAFPWWIALVSTTGALVLFFSSTAPALAELRYLREEERATTDHKVHLQEALDRDGLHQVGLEFDIQSILMELDQRGVAPEALAEPAPEPIPRPR